jgi:DNA (cytosine-5)-methyltransferase 1
VDLFAGIGGFRLYLNAVEGNCAFSSDRDKCSRKTDKASFGETLKGNLYTLTPVNVSYRDSLIKSML